MALQYSMKYDIMSSAAIVEEANALAVFLLDVRVQYGR